MLSDLDYGIMGFFYEGKATGGMIKVNPEDFVVLELVTGIQGVIPIPKPPDEMIEHGDEGGLYIGGRVWKKGIDHARMTNLIAREFRVQPGDVSTAGIKDANAETVQLFSVYQPRREVSDPCSLGSNIEIDSFNKYREKMYPGRMPGNHFEIVIRNTKSTEELGQFKEFLDNGVLNHYGYQRFGGNRPITAEFGRLFLNKKYKEAVDLYIGGKSQREDEPYRKMWRDNQDPSELLLNWDSIPQIEKEMVKQLAKKPGDYKAVLRKVPEFLINISRSAFISFLFNHYISRRGDDLNPLVGERETRAVLRERKNIEIAQPSMKWSEPLNDIWKEVFDYVGLEMKELKTIKHTTRLLKVYPIDWNHEITGEKTIQTSFSLPSGSYATTILRELMQELPDAYF